MISETINLRIAQALKSRDEIRLSTLRMLSSALNYEKIAKQHDLSEKEEIAVVRREAKKRNDAIKAYEQVGDRGGVRERIEREKKELGILKEYLPVEMSDEELSQLINESINQLVAKSIQDMGRVIGEVMKKAGGRAEGYRVAALVKERLT